VSVPTMMLSSDGEPEGKIPFPSGRGIFFVAAIVGVVFQAVASLLGARWHAGWPFWTGVAVALGLTIVLVVVKQVRRRRGLG